MKHTITRRIEIDAGHRVPDHGSKCANLHGHRYVVEAVCEGPLAEQGEQTGMVLDFSFLKAAMVEQIHDRCDHRFIFAWWDAVCRKMFLGGMNEKELRRRMADGGAVNGCLAFEFAARPEAPKLAYYIVDFSPTAENLARHWAELLAPEVARRSDGRGRLVAVRVHETPNCMAEYQVTTEK